jgi:hypothetical protein
MKIIAYVLILVLLLAAAFIILKGDSDNTIKYGGIELSQKDYESAKELFKDEPGFVVCSLKNGECMSLLKLPKK